MTRVFLMSLTFFSFCFFYGNAQKPSKNHTVKKGETVYQLSRIYNVSVNDIFELNPNASSLIYVDQILKIPISEETQNTPKNEQQNPVKTDSSFVYKVKRGDTKSGLSRKFGITIGSLENQNPHINPVLQAGHVLNINNSNYLSQSQSQNTSKPQNTGLDGFHEVVKGDTFYGISKQYGVDLNLLMNVNASVIPKKMAIGSQIKIPNSGSNALASIQNRTEYLVKKGDTKYGLSKTFDTSIGELERLNPQIIDMLRYGTIIKIPSEDNNTIAQTNNDKPLEEEEEEEESMTEATSTESETETETETDVVNQDLEPNTKNPDNTVLNDSTQLTENIKNIDSIAINTNVIEVNQNDQLVYKSYVIEPKQTLYGLSKKAGMTVPEFLKLNPQLSESVTIGMIIKMPIKSFDSIPVNTIPQIKNELPSNAYTDLSSIITSKTDKKILMLMPFSDVEYKYYTKNINNYNAITNVDLQNSIQFYNGTKTAIDSLDGLGIKTEISLVKASNALENVDLNSFDAIITSSLNTEIKSAMSANLNNDIPIIVINSDSHDYQIKTVYQAIPSAEVQMLKTLQYLNQQNGNIIAISDIDRLKSRSLIEKFSPNVKIFVTNSDNEFSESDIISNLDKNRTNYIIIDSKKNSVFLSSTTLLLGQSSNYKIQIAILESSLLPNEQQISSKRFSILKLIYPDLTQITNNPKTLNYFNSYKLIHGIEPTKKVLQGFDITFDVILRLSQDISFEKTTDVYKTEYLALKFDYKKNELGVFDNHEIVIREFKNLDIGN